MTILFLALSLFLTQQTARAEFGVIRGQVRAQNGSPAVGIRVAAMVVDGSGVSTAAASELTTLAQTDTEGKFHLENVPPGRYVIMAGYLDAPSYFPGVVARDKAHVLVVTAGLVTERIDFSLPIASSVRVRGRITNLPEKAPLTLFSVNLLNRPRSGSPPMARPEPPLRLEASLMTGGTFEFSNVPPGNYSLQVAQIQVSNLQVIGDKDLEGIEAVAPATAFGWVTMDDGTPLPLQQEAVVAGVADPPALIRLERPVVGVTAQALASQATQVSADGFFVFVFNAPREYAINPLLMPAGYYVKSARWGELNLLKSPLPMTRESTQTPIEIVLTRTRPSSAPPGMKVSGRVNELQRAPTGGRVLVSLQSLGFAADRSVGAAPLSYAAQAFVKEDGTFELMEVPEGRYTIRTFPYPSAAVASVIVRSPGITGIALTLRDPAAPIGRGGTAAVAGPAAVLPLPLTVVHTLFPLAVPADAGMVSIAQSGRYPAEWREGAWNYFRIERAGSSLQEKSLTGPLTFTLAPGAYELHGYSRACNGNCGRLDPPRLQCNVSFTIAAGEVLYAERIIQANDCSIRLGAAPR